jgi:maltooligosyltrehalose trehalohydrolase
VVRSPERGGYGLDAQWSDDFHHALHATLTGEHIGYYEDFAGGIPQIAKALTDTFVYDGAYSRHRQRHHGRPATGIPQHRFLGYLQTHDQVGNRARGERISHLTTLGKAKIGAALVLFSPFIPMIFQGEEFAASTPFQYFTNHHDPDLAQAVSEGRRREFAAFGWRPEDVPDPQDPETFQRSKLNWEEIELSPHREMLAWYKELIQLRKSLPRMTAVDYGEDWISIRRGDYQLTCNLTDGTAGIVDL